MVGRPVQSGKAEGHSHVNSINKHAATACIQAGWDTGYVGVHTDVIRVDPVV